MPCPILGSPTQASSKMSTKSELQALLRFLSQDAKVPLPIAMGKVKELQKADLTSPETLAKSDLGTVQAIFPDDKLAKQVLNAAKRVTKKRTLGDANPVSPAKRKKTSFTEESLSPAVVEDTLALPEVKVDEDELRSTVLHTNRAPLVLAFAVTLLKYTMPFQPLSSRLSLAQAVVSVNSRAKAVSLGMEKGKSAEDDGWGQGQPKIRIMGRDIRVMKRWGYEWKGKAEKPEIKTEDVQPGDSQDTLKQENQAGDEPALWGLDLEALRSSNGPLVSGAQGAHASGLPIYNAQSARAYLLKAFASPTLSTEESSLNKKSPANLKAEKERNLALLLQALDLLYSSWAYVLGREELDKRAWAWYVAVRPDVEHGVAGWGGKGEVELNQILDLRRNG
ncbi:hypothetical protein N7G274_001771 [Stereocaulon virgatum]|uniref:Uncharacterized protein n=1 Tax=Stereocaulon virgatum TaxID=373712 RepID=A0ABR4ANR9_9LECA